MNATPAPTDLAPRMRSGQPVRRRLRWGLLCLLLGSGCAADRTTIEVEVAGLSGQEKQLLLDATLDGRMLDVAPPPFTSRLNHFQVHMDPQFTGMLTLVATTLGGDGCQLAQGSTVVPVPSAGNYSASLALAEQAGCLLVIRKVGMAPGQVKLSDGTLLSFDTTAQTPEVCPHTQDSVTEAQKAFPLNTKVTLTAMESDNSAGYFGGWAQACHGSSTCTVDISAGITVVEADFVNRQTCSRDMFCWEQPLPQGSQVRTITGSSATEVWALTSSGTLLKWNGTFWDTSPAPQTQAPLTALFSPGPGALWAVGQQGTVVRLESGSWACPSQIAQADLTSVWASGPQDAWAAGAQGTLMHWNGTTWTATTVPGGVRADLQAVAGVSATDVWAVGSGGTVLHYDGSAWSRINFPTSDMLRGVWPSGPQDAWVVGDHGAMSHITGKTAGPIVMGPPLNLRGVFGADAKNVWAVGEQGAAIYTDGQIVIGQSADTTQELLAIWGSAASDFWAVGQNGVLTRYNGSYWRQISTYPDGQALGAIWGVPISGMGPPNLASPVLIAGDQGLVLRLGGTRWTREPSLQGVTSRNYRAIWGSQATDIWLVGEGGVAVHWNTMTGTLWPTGTTSDLLAVWGSGPANVLAVGTGGTLARYDGTKWTASVLAAAANHALNALWGSSSGQVFIAGDSGTLLAYDGVNAAAVPISTLGALHGLWGSGAGDVWAVGDGGMILHYDGASWRPHPQSGQLTTSALRSLWGTAPNAVWATGDRGTLLYFDGATWTPKSSGTDQNLKGVWSSQGTGTILIGDGASILVKR